MDHAVDDTSQTPISAATDNQTKIRCKVMDQQELCHHQMNQRTNGMRTQENGKTTQETVSLNKALQLKGLNQNFKIENETNRTYTVQWFKFILF